MLAFQAPPLPRQGQTVMSVKTKKVVALHRVGLCFQVPKTCVIPLYHKAMRLSELYGKFMANVTQVWRVKTHNPESLADYSTKVQ